MDSPLAANSQQ